MAGTGQQEPRPLWVRIVIRARTTRKTAIASVGMLVLFAAISLSGAAIEFGNETLLAKIAFPLGVATCCFATAAAVTTWLAVRWVDQKGRWPSR